MDEEIAWSRLTGSDESIAEQAHAFLMRLYLPMLHPHLRYHAQLLNSDDRGEIINTTFLNLWNTRTRYKIAGEAAGRALLFTMLRRTLIDFVRKRKAIDSHVMSDQEVGIREPVSCGKIEDKVLNGILAAQLLAAADSLWLGLDSALLPETHNRQLIAARMYYCDKFSTADIVGVLKGSPAAGEQVLTRDQVEAWVKDLGVLRYLAYTQLCISRARVLAAVLRMHILSHSAVLELHQTASARDPTEAAIADLSWGMIGLAVARYYFCESADLIVTGRSMVTQQWQLDREQLASILHALRDRLPYRVEAAQLQEALHETGPTASRNVLSTQQVWERLAFQHSYLFELAQKDILERMQPAAGVGGYPLTSATVNSWISGRRLQDKLLKHWEELFGDDANGS